MSIEDQIKVKLYRSFDGLTVKAWANPSIENFIRSLGEGDPTEVRVVGRYWTSVKESPPLMIHRISDPGSLCISGILGSGDCFYRLDRPGHQLMEFDHSPLNGAQRNVVNLGFLRLVGISNENGIMFRVNGVYPSDAIRGIRDSIGAACRSFYITYMKPMKLRVVLSTEPEDVICK